MADSEEQLKRMVMTFRVSELQMLLGYAGKNKTGRKNELQSRALDLVRLPNPSVQQKIRDLYKSIQLEMMSFGDRSQAAATGIMQSQRGPSMGLNSMPAGYDQSGSVSSNLNRMAHNTTGYTSRSSSKQLSQLQVSSQMTNSGFNLHSSHNSSYPISPDVRLKNLPFYDILAELLKPSTLAPHGSGHYQEANFSFSLTPQQANKIANSRDLRPGKLDYGIQVQMRFCLLETTCEQEDNFPPNITVKINDKLCPLPNPIPTNKAGVEPKRPSRPVNVTTLCKISPTVSNRILVSWSSEYGRCYVISVYLVQKLTSNDLLQRLKNKGGRLADFTRSLIKQKLMEDSECEIATTSLRCSLLCPLGKMRMAIPCRADTCNHLQCFDASLFLQMNERKATWMCPVCDKTAFYDNLVIDGYFQEVLQKDSDCTEVTLQKDGNWTPLIPKKETKDAAAAASERRKTEVAVETLSVDSDDEPERNVEVDKDDSVIEEVRAKRKNPEVEIITLTDSEDDSGPPASKRPAYQSSNSTSAPSHPSSSSGKGSGGAGGDSATAVEGNRHESSQERAVPAFECTKSSDSWHVGEVDPGKRLIFRKSVSSSSNGSGGVSAPPNNGLSHSAPSPESSGSTSPQIICLDSPASSPSPPPHLRQSSSSHEQQSLTPPPVHSSGGTSAPPPYSNGTSGYATMGSSSDNTQSSTTAESCLVSFGGGSAASSGLAVPQASVGPVTITPVVTPTISPTGVSTSPTTAAAAAAAAASYILQDPMASPTYIPSSPYSLPNLFNPLSMIPPSGTGSPTNGGSSSSSLASYNRSNDRYI